jgi:hypothetical protein
MPFQDLGVNSAPKTRPKARTKSASVPKEKSFMDKELYG